MDTKLHLIPTFHHDIAYLRPESWYTERATAILDKALQLMEKMESYLGIAPKTYDPWVSTTIVDNQYHDFETFLGDIDVLVVMVHHSHLDKNIALVENKLVFDTRNCRLNWPESNDVAYL